MGNNSFLLDCLRIASLSLAHTAQFLVAKVLTALIGSTCQMMLQVVPPRWLTCDGFVSWNWVAKCLVHASHFSLSLTSFWTSLKCCCIVFPAGMHAFPVLLHLTLQTVVEFLHVLLWPWAPFPPVLRSELGKSVARHRHSQPSEVAFVFDSFDD